LGSVAGRIGLGHSSADGLRVAFPAHSGEVHKMRLPVRGQWQDVEFSTKKRMIVDGVPGPVFDEVETVVFSPDGNRIAYRAKKGEKWCAVLDGKIGPEFDVVCEAIFSPDGRRVAYAAEEGGTWHVVVDGQIGPAYNQVREPVFSPDGKRVAYEAEIDGKWRAIVDGRPQAPFDEVGGVEFSPGGEHFKYVVYMGTKDRRQRLVIDEKPMKAFDRISTSCFSRDGTRWAYVGVEGRGNRTAWHHVFVDGQKIGAYTGSSFAAFFLTFSDDGEHLAFEACVDGKKVLIVDGEAKTELLDGKVYWDTDLFKRSARLAYVWHINGKARVVLDGKPGPAYDQILSTERGSVVYSDDDSHHAYVAQKGQKDVVVVDGDESPEYDDVWSYSLQLSRDGRTHAFVAPEGKRRFMVVNGRPHLEHEWVGPPRISPDGKTVAYIAEDNQQSFLVVNGERRTDLGAKTTYSNEPQFSPDSKHIVCIPRKQVVLDGEFGPKFDDIIYPGPLFHPNGVLEYLIVRKDVLYQVRHVPVR
jgi:Tol biopolymer transport system component